MNNPGEPRLICIMSLPETRTACPDTFVEGYWMEIRPDVEEIQLKPSPGQQDPAYAGKSLMARPSGKVARRGDMLSAPIWTVRWENA